MGTFEADQYGSENATMSDEMVSEILRYVTGIVYYTSKFVMNFRTVEEAEVAVAKVLISFVIDGNKADEQVEQLAKLISSPIAVSCEFAYPSPQCGPATDRNREINLLIVQLVNGRPKAYCLPQIISKSRT